MNGATSRSEAIAALNSIVFACCKPSATGRALNHVRTTILAAENGRRSGTEAVTLLFVDGVSAESDDVVQEEAALLRAEVSRIALFAVDTDDAFPPEAVSQFLRVVGNESDFLFLLSDAEAFLAQGEAAFEEQVLSPVLLGVVPTTPVPVATPTPSASLPGFTLTPSSSIFATLRPSSSLFVAPQPSSSVSDSPFVSASSLFTALPTPSLSSSLAVPPSASVSPSPMPRLCDFLQNDVAFVLDGSGSVGEEQHQAQVEMIRAAAARLPLGSGANDSRIAVAEVRNTPRFHVNFTGGTDRMRVDDILADLTYTSNFASTVATTLELVVEGFQVQGRQTAERSLIFFTDGEAAEGDAALFEQIAALEALGVNMVFVGLSSAGSVDMQRIEEIAPPGSRILTLEFLQGVLGLEGSLGIFDVLLEPLVCEQPLP